MPRFLRLPDGKSLFNVEVCLRAAASARRGPDASRTGDGPTDLFLCLVDHYEPQLGGASRELALGAFPMEIGVDSFAAAIADPIPVAASIKTPATVLAIVINDLPSNS